jgi:hypothetical protein
MMVSTVLKSQSQVYSYENIRWCSVTVEHPFDKNISTNVCDDWVELVNMNDDSLDQEALLLCPYSDVEWVAWFPSEGKRIIHVDNMCRIPSKN